MTSLIIWIPIALIYIIWIVGLVYAHDKENQNDNSK